MADVTFTFSKKEMRILQYLLNGASNQHALLDQMSNTFKEYYKNLSSVGKVSIDELEDLQDAINYLSYIDERWGVSSFAKELSKKKPEIFKALVEFVFLPAKKRKGYSFHKNTRATLGEQAAKSGMYIPKVIEHYFKLYAKNGSSESRQRISRWMELDIVRKHKTLLMILANSSLAQVQIDTISLADKSMLGFLVNVDNELAKWYLDRTMNDPGWYGREKLAQTKKLIADTGRDPLTEEQEKNILRNSSPSYYELSNMYRDYRRGAAAP